MQMTILLTISYTFRAVKEVFFGPLKPHLDVDTVKDPPLTMSIPLLFVAAVSILLGMYPKIIMDFFHLVIGKV
jgi:NADH:ubiquinone oxidoreductase subunit 5 (subunit L)/multisubunit Na+/H+ antiporter MnhA subunit